MIYFLTDIKMQNIDDKGLPFLVTLNPPRTPDNMLLKWTTGHPMPSVAASKASLELHRIQGKRGIKFCGAYQGTHFSSSRGFDPSEKSKILKHTLQKISICKRKYIMRRSNRINL